MRVMMVVIGLAAVLAATSVGAAAAPSPSPGGGFGSPACLRGDWVAGRAETSRVTRALVPVDGFDIKGKLYMQFRDGRYQYGTTGLVINNTIGDVRLTATGRFFSLHRYAATPGVLQLANGERTTTWGRFTAIKDGKTFSVPGPAPKTQRAAGGLVPFQCRGGTLRVRLPQFASLNWITLRRA
jgi:hypothetical protein